jgi:hypothetical protein
MSDLFPILYLIVCSLAATRLTYRICDRRIIPELVTKFLIWTVGFFSVFYGGFYVLGLINLFTGLPIVGSLYALCVVLVSWLIVERVSRQSALTDTHGGMNVRIFEWRKIRLPGSGIVRTLAILTVGAFALMGMMLAVGFPRGYESQGYHLPIAVNIFQTGSLKVWTVWKTIFIHTFPANGSIYFGFLLTFLSEHFVAASGLLFLLLLGIAEYAIGMEIGRDENASLLAALGIITIPIITFPGLAAGSDVGGAAFLAIAIYFTLTKNAGLPYGPALGGLAAGIAFGFKSLHLIGVAFLFVAKLLQAKHVRTSEGSESIGIRNMAADLAVFSLAFLSMSGFWLLRNYVQLGNPLYPVHVGMFDLLGWSKAGDFASVADAKPLQFYWVQSSIEWLVYPWVEWLEVGKEFNKPGLGAFFAASMPVAVLAALVNVTRRSVPRRFLLGSLLIGGMIIVIAWFLLNDRQPRYFIGALVFFAPLVAWLASQLSRLRRRVFDIIVSLCILLTVWMTFSWELIGFGQQFIYGRAFERSAFYQYPPVLDQLPSGSTVVNLAHRTRNYSLHGKSQQNRVIVYSEARSVLEVQTPAADEAAQVAHLSAATLRHAAATHLFTEGSPKLFLDDCLSLQEIGKLDKDLVGNSLDHPFTLYKINYCQG